MSPLPSFLTGLFIVFALCAIVDLIIGNDDDEH